MATTASTTGISKSGLNKLITKLEEYRSAVMKKCDVGAKTAVIQAAIKGSTSEAGIKTLANTIDNTMKNYIKQLNTYDELLQQVKKTYTSDDSSNTTFTDVAKGLGK